MAEVTPEQHAANQGAAAAPAPAAPAPTPASPVSQGTLSDAIQRGIQDAILPLQTQLDEQNLARRHGLSDDQLAAVRQVRTAHPTLEFEKAIRFAAIEHPDKFPPKPAAFQPARHGVIAPGGDSPARSGPPPAKDPRELMREAIANKDRRAATYHAHQAFAAQIKKFSPTAQ